MPQKCVQCNARCNRRDAIAHFQKAKQDFETWARSVSSLDSPVVAVASFINKYLGVYLAFHGALSVNQGVWFYDEAISAANSGCCILCAAQQAATLVY